MTEQPGRDAFAGAQPLGEPTMEAGAIGSVLAIGGSGSGILVDLLRIEAPADDPDAVVAQGGGAQVKVRLGAAWLVANIRSLRYVDAMLRKHFALLGSTGTSKSTSAA